MSILRITVLVVLLVAANFAHGQPSAEQAVLEAIKSPDLNIVHLWAPWCSNCQAELKSGGWLKVDQSKSTGEILFRVSLE